MKKKLVCLLCFLLAAKLSPAQVIDSLLKVLPASKDTQRVKLLYSLCFEYAYSEPEKGKRYGAEALELSEKLNYTLGKAKTLNRIGIIYDVTGKYDSAIYCYTQAGNYYVKAKNIKGKGSSLNNIGLIYGTLGNYPKAISTYFEALKIFEDVKDEGYVASALNNIANAYADISKYDLAFRYYSQAAVINKKINDQQALASNYTNIASSLRECHKPDSALYYANKSLEIQTVLNNQYGLGILYTLLGNIYADLGLQEKTLPFLLKSLKIRNELNDEAGKASVLYVLSVVYKGLKNPVLAEKYALEAHELALKNKSYRMLRKTALFLFNFYKETGEFKKASEFVDVAIMAKDSALNEEGQKSITNLEIKYETEKRELEFEKKSLALENATLEIKQKRSTIVLLISACLLILLFGFGIYSYIRNRNRRSLDAQMLSQQELRNKAIIDAEEKERVRIARELHDGIGQQLSAAKMNLSAFEFSVADQDKAKFKDLIALVDDAVKEVRTISHNMIPNALLRSGLASAIRDFVNKLSGTNALKIDLHIVGISERLDTTLEAVLYRVIQECMSNIVKHSQATQVNIQLIRHEDHLNLVIEDNGKGFDAKNVENLDGIGLKNIISRVHYLNGTVDFDSLPGKGTTIIVDVPITKEQPNLK
ncbi:hypothetical protein CNR22_16500 [Sphingobacteriaceae bacterium]|nr:hypothetical protein CNR22_16500 [Sphingobacteriaceae bacterium]